MGKKKKKTEKPEENAEAGKKKDETAAKAEDELDRLKQELNEAQDRFIRSKADLENYRKRVQREMTETREYAKLNTVEQFLPVFDHFQMAMMHVGENSDVKTLKQGMDMILNEFSRTFEALGVKQVDAEGQKFDPNVHEAMAQEPSDEIPEGHVKRQWKCGYRLGERLLRPATVVVSSGPADQKNETHKEKEEEEENK